MSEQTEMDWLPSDDDVATYRRRGWLTTPTIIPTDLIQEAAARAEEFHTGTREPAPLKKTIKSYLDWTPESKMRLRLNDYIVLRDPVFRELGCLQQIGAIAARLAHTEGIRLFNSSLIYKPPQVVGNDVTVGWHTDRAYWQTCSSDRMLTAWIPLHDVSAEMGTVTMLDGSHAWPRNARVNELSSVKNFITSDADAFESSLKGLGLEFRPIPIELSMGRVSFHHCLLFHGSPPNASARPRVSVAVHLQDAENQYRSARDPEGNPFVYNNDLFCRKDAEGNPDYSDPDICPVVWPPVQ